MKNISIIGSTGSIGTQALDIVRANDDLRVVALACGKNIEMVEKLNGEKEMDKSGISSLKNNDVTRVSELHKNQHGSMSSLYQ